MGTPKGSVPWNAGTSKGWTDKRGYRWLYVDGRARREHRVVVERDLGRRLEPWELVHHKDGNPTNNALENLEVCEFGSHTADHHTGTRKSAAAKRSMEVFALMRGELERERAAKADLYEALQEAAQVFRQYEVLHRAKRTPEAELKAVANGVLAIKCEAALAKADPRS